MKHTNNATEQKPNTRSKVMARLLLLIISTFMAFAGAQSTPTTKASAPCDMVCTQYIDPSDGQCYIACCPADDQCKMPCERTRCK